MTRSTLLLFAAPLLLMGADCSRTLGVDPPASRPETRVDRVLPARASNGAPMPLVLFDLHDADGVDRPPTLIPTATTSPLDPARQDALLARLDDLPVAERIAFRQRPDSPPPLGCVRLPGMRSRRCRFPTSCAVGTPATHAPASRRGRQGLVDAAPMPGEKGLFSLSCARPSLDEEEAM